MLKHQNIIDKLTAEQKLMLAASLDALGEPWAEKAGIPRVDTADLEDLNRDNGKLYPAFFAMANSWNMHLIKEAAKDLTLLSREESAVAVFTPPMGVKSNPFKNGASEDPFLAGACAEAVCGGIETAGAMPCLAGASLTEEDGVVLDKAVSHRALYEYYLAPFSARGKEGRAYFHSYRQTAGGYADVNRGEINGFLHECAGRSGFVVAETDDGGEAQCAASGNILLRGRAENLGTPAAYAEKATSREGVLLTGVLSADELDAAADRAIGFAEACAAARLRADGEEPADRTELFLKAAEESIVLLKNTKLLPLRVETAVAVIGNSDAARKFAEHLKNGPFRSVGYAQGYSKNGGRDDNLIAEAKRLAEKSDAVLVILDGVPRKNGEKNVAAFSANRLALLDEVTGKNPNVAVVVPAAAADVSFAPRVSALLAADLESSAASEALSNVLSGKVCPSGKLASAMYFGADGIFEELKEKKDAGTVKIGPFVGYRRYDTEGSVDQFPFGYGLSYTSFFYSGFAVTDGRAEFTVRNTGDKDGSEIVQLYAGKPDSAVVRPKKQLIGFQKVFLRAGESVRLSLEIDLSRLAAYNNGGFAVEDGSYRLYVASSVNDVRLEATVRVAGKKLLPDNNDLSDYLPSVSNVYAGNYTLGRVKEKKRNTRLNKLGVIFLLIGLMSESFFLLLNAIGLIDIFYNNDAIFLSVMMVFFFPPMFVAGSVMLIVDWARKRKGTKFTVISEGCGRFLPELQPELSFKDIFEQSFAVSDKEENLSGREKEEEIYFSFDRSFTFAAAEEELARFFEERGLKLADGCAKKILAAFGTSRLLVLKSDDESVLPRFIGLLQEYFGNAAPVSATLKCGEMYGGELSAGAEIDKGEDGNEACGIGAALKKLKHIEIANSLDMAAGEKDENVLRMTAESAKNAEDFRFSGTIPEHGRKNPAQGYAPRAEQRVKIKEFCGDAEGLKEFIRPYAGYIAAPEAAHRAEKDSGFMPNVWFVFAPETRDDAASAAVLPSACVVDIAAVACAEKYEKSPFRPLERGQLSMLTEEAHKTHCLDEDSCWKKVDRLEACVNACVPYRICNKQWIALEKYSSICCACGGSQDDALDNALAAVVLPSMIAALDGMENADAEFARNAEKIFGAGRGSVCKKMLGDFAAVNFSTERTK